MLLSVGINSITCSKDDLSKALKNGPLESYN